MGTESIILIVLSTIVSIFTLAAIGGNDVANSQGTAVGSGALSLRGAQILAGICEFAGAALVGHQVSNTIGSEMINRENVSDLQYCWGMFSGLLSVGIWMIVSTKIKMPVSATHSIIGALFGLNLVMTEFNFAAIEWDILGKIAIAWIVTPLLSFIASFTSLYLLNYFWPTVHDRDKNIYEYQSHSLIGKVNIQQPPIVHQASIGGASASASFSKSFSQTKTVSLLSFVMAPPSPVKNRGGSAAQLERLHNEENRITIDNSDNTETEYFKPAKLKFGLIFGVLMATLTVFIMVGGPKSINIAEGENAVEGWIIAVISFGTLVLFIIIGYLIEPFYRYLYAKYVYSINTKDTSRVHTANTKIKSGDGADNGIDGQQKRSGGGNLTGDTQPVVVSLNDQNAAGKVTKSSTNDHQQKILMPKINTDLTAANIELMENTNPNVAITPNPNTVATPNRSLRSLRSLREVTPLSMTASTTGSPRRLKQKLAAFHQNEPPDPKYSKLMDFELKSDVDIYGGTDDSSDEMKTKSALKFQSKQTTMITDKKTDISRSIPLSFNNQDYFRLYLIIASGAVSFAHGGNDVANVLGPFGQIYEYATSGEITGEQEIPIYISGAAGLIIAIGFALFGAPVLETIGKSITQLSYRSGFTAQFCAAATVLVCNILGLPVSSSTVIVGGVAGVGYYNAKQAKKYKTKPSTKDNKKRNDVSDNIGICQKCKDLWQKHSVRILIKILAIWIITIPINATFCGSIYAIINAFL